MTLWYNKLFPCTLCTYSTCEVGGIYICVSPSRTCSSSSLFNNIFIVYLGIPRFVYRIGFCFAFVNVYPFASALASAFASTFCFPYTYIQSSCFCFWVWALALLSSNSYTVAAASAFDFYVCCQLLLQVHRLYTTILLPVLDFGFAIV